MSYGFFCILFGILVHFSRISFAFHMFFLRISFAFLVHVHVSCIPCALYNACLMFFFNALLMRSINSA